MITSKKTSILFFLNIKTHQIKINNSKITLCLLLDLTCIKIGYIANVLNLSKCVEQVQTVHSLAMILISKLQCLWQELFYCL